MDEITPNEIARSLGVTGLQFRNWLRAQKDAGHPLVAAHEYRTRYRFTRAKADQLAAEFRSGAARAVRHARPARGARAARTPSTAAARPADPFAGLLLSEDPGHRVTETWMGERVLTLADLLRALG